MVAAPGEATPPRLARRGPGLLWVDSVGGLLVGTVVVAAPGALSRLYRMPRAAVVGLGVANLAYGAFSGSLALRQRRSPGQIAALVAANAAWAAACGLAAARLAGTASVFGIAHLVAEGAYVGGLAALEWRHRDRLLGTA